MGDFGSFPLGKEDAVYNPGSSIIESISFVLELPFFVGLPDNYAIAFYGDSSFGVHKGWGSDAIKQCFRLCINEISDDTILPDCILVFRNYEKVTIPPLYYADRIFGDLLEEVLDEEEKEIRQRTLIQNEESIAA